MLVFIDESGDAGFRLNKGSSKIFTVGLVIFDDELDAEDTALIIKKFRRLIGKSDIFEFKFNKLSKILKLEFLNTVKDCKFRVRAIVINKENINSPILRNSINKFYSFIVKEALRNNNNTISNAKIRLDGLGERAFRRELVTYLRKHLNSRENVIIKNLRFRDSKSDVLIQLADMVAGAISRFYDFGETDRKEYFEIIKKRIGNVWEFE